MPGARMAAFVEGDHFTMKSAHVAVLAAVAAPVVGGVAAFAASVGLVMSTTSAPDENPAQGSIITYGK